MYVCMCACFVWRGGESACVYVHTYIYMYKCLTVKQFADISIFVLNSYNIG